MIELFEPSPDLPDDTPLETVRFPTRIYNALTHVGVRTIGEIRELSDEALISFPYVGFGSVKWLREKLSNKVP